MLRCEAPPSSSFAAGVLKRFAVRLHEPGTLVPPLDHQHHRGQTPACGMSLRSCSRRPMKRPQTRRGFCLLGVAVVGRGVDTLLLLLPRAGSGLAVLPCASNNEGCSPLPGSPVHWPQPASENTLLTSWRGLFRFS